MTDSTSSANGTSLPPRNREGSRRLALDLFKAKESRNALIYQQMETDRVVSDAKIAKLRALRLAKEESDRAAATIAEETRNSTSRKKKPAASHAK